MSECLQIRPTFGGPHPVDILAFADAQLLDIAGPLQVFASANDLLRAAGRPSAYATRVLAREAPLVTTSSGLALAASPLAGVRESQGSLIVSGGRGVHAAADDPALLNWLRGRVGGGRICSVCTGAFLLAAAGILDGRRAVTHWKHVERLARSYPAIRVEADPLFIEDGDVWTSAGVTAGIDLALALVERDQGATLALAVARSLVVFLKRPGGQAQFSQTLSMQTRADGFADLHAWVEGHLDEDLSVARLARRAAMSERSFRRHYAEATGTTPARMVERLRVEAARILLDGSGVSLKEMARRLGFGGEEKLRRSFQRQLGVTPSDYRQRFAASAFNGGDGVPARTKNRRLA
ncbi:transcriptional regulator, AraC family with amidase-like domain [Arboricoccus pini]|uniref:Transcriptional regulator, AraC family with amidase-like domain n=1 Tax=Arboricoccus pini TaxID=1963835 RepID=A0A212RUQ4_9PROT|nr:GlxA family transcriptional regulator [Arboricoccus pini]SNB76428.1 transcriptional regulator, AraC family with amidase-like domain [Arboricoccus pini]